jgi:hypothetical protein
MLLSLNPASDLDLKEKTGIIYAIKNSYDNKIYVGMSKLSFHQRYRGNWKNNTKNKPLRGVLSKYPNNKFEIYILEHGIKGEDNLLKREFFWANQLNCYCPLGYNTRECGSGATYFGSGKISSEEGKKKYLKSYLLKVVLTGEIIEINNLPKWAEENKLKCNCLRNLLCGLVVESQGFCLPETSDLDLLNKRNYLVLLH